MMREFFLKQVQLRDAQGTLRSYDYYITAGEMNVGQYCCESYGVRVAERGGEEAAVDNITASVARIDELCELLIRNQVTPVTLVDVISDWL